MKKGNKLVLLIVLTSLIFIITLPNIFASWDVYPVSPSNEINYDVFNQSFVFNITNTSETTISDCSFKINDGSFIEGSWCYQETANISTSCGGLNTGNYSYNGTWSLPNYLYDTNYNSLTTSSDEGYSFLNYTKPFSAVGAMWYTKDHLRTTNVSIIDSCWNYDINTLVLSVKSSSNELSASWYCYNESGWNLLDESVISHVIYEEAIWWNLSTYIETNTSLQTTGTDVGFNYTLTDNGTYRWNVTCCDSNYNCNNTGLYTYSVSSEDMVSPTTTNLANNGSTAKIDDVVKFNVTIADDSLNYYVFAHNQTGTLTNQTPLKVSGTSYEATYNLTVTLTTGSKICGMFWVNDTTGNINYTNQTCFEVVDCSTDAHCGTCEKCTDNACVNQLATEDLKTECSASFNACSNDYTRQGPDGYCDGAGACDTDGAFLNVSVGNVCDGGSDVNPSSGIKCGTWSSCTADACSASEYYVGYAGDGTTTCNDTDWQAAGTTYNVPNNYIIDKTNQSDTCNITTTGKSPSYDACLNDYTRQGPDGYCDGSGSLDTNDALLNVSVGNICSSGTDDNPNGLINCGTWSSCTADACSALEYYVGYMGDGTTTCNDTDWNATGTTYNVPNDYIITNTNNSDTCNTTNSGESPSYDACSNDYTRQGPDGYCDGAGSLDANDALLNVSAGNVCSSGTDDNPNGLINCSVWSDCTSGTTQSNEYYVGFVGNGSGVCIETDWNSTGGTWDTPTGYTIDTTETVDTCSYSDITPPYFLYNSSNASSSKINKYSYFNISLNDDVGLSHYFFDWNDTSIWVNITGASTSGTQDNITTTQQITAVKGTIIGYRWHANDTNDNWNSSEILTFTVLNTAPTLKTDLSFSNHSIGHSFNVTAVFSDADNSSDFSNYTIESSSGTCSNVYNITSGNDMTVRYNCTGAGLVSTTIRINASDGTSMINSSELTNTYPNQIPTVTGVTINDSTPLDTDNLNCSFTSLNDDDGDTVSVIEYDWIKDSTPQGINSSWLDFGNTTGGENWQCTIIPFDSYVNGSIYTSSSVSIDTSFVAPSINFTNATTAKTGINSTSLNPTNNNSWVNLTTTFYDENEDKWTAYFCSTDSATASGCTETTYCNSSINSTDTTLSCEYDVSGLLVNSLTYYTFVIDNSSLISSSLSNTFHINHAPDIPVIVTPSGNSNVNYTFINYTSSDLNGDVINITIYNSSNGADYSELYSGATTYFNWTNITDGTYYIKAYTFDEHGYSLLINSSVTTFKIDSTLPVISSVYTSTIAMEPSTALTFYINATDNFNMDASSCTFTLLKSNQNLGDGIGVAYNFSSDTKSSNSYSREFASGTFTDGNLQFTKAYCTDSFGNVAENSSVGINITLSTEPTATPPAGGGGTTTETVITSPTNLTKEQIAGLCGNGICEEGENPWACFEDCGPKLFEFDQIFCLPLFKCGNWETQWFNNLMILLILGSVIVWYINKTNPAFFSSIFKQKQRRVY